MELETLVFEIAERRLGLPLTAVREVLTLGPVTPVPTAPAAVAGLVNVRGQVVPVIDLGRLLGSGVHRLRLGDPVVLVEAGGTRLGLLVDRVLGLSQPPETRGAEAERQPLLDENEVLVSLGHEVAAATAAAGPASGAPA